jgi:hypothetical protein
VCGAPPRPDMYLTPQRHRRFTAKRADMSCFSDHPVIDGRMRNVIRMQYPQVERAKEG